VTSHNQDAATRRGDRAGAVWLHGRWQDAIEVARDLDALADGPAPVLPQTQLRTLLAAWDALQQHLVDATVPTPREPTATSNVRTP